MRWIRIVFRILVLVLFAAIVDYSLPAIDVVRIVGTEVVRTDVSNGAFFWGSKSSGANASENRDVRFINSVYPNEKSRVYRNEDTGWGWPPYFKFNSGDLHAQAQSFVNDEVQWVAVRHYGWRFTPLSIFPNAVRIWQVASPGDTIINYTRIAGIIFCILIVLIIWRLWYLIRLWIGDKYQSVRRRFR